MIAFGYDQETDREVLAKPARRGPEPGTLRSDAIAGDLTAGTRLMVITTTAAALAAGLLRLGRYTRFGSFSVMIGFLTGVAADRREPAR